MIPASFSYARPRSLDEAFALLSEHGSDAKLLAGGHSLLPMMKLRLATPGILIDISRITGLDSIKAGADGVAIGALTTHAAIAASADVARILPALADAASNIGDAQVRNRGTIGGACAHGDPASDYPAVLLALDASVSIHARSGAKTIPAADFFRGMFDTALTPDAVLTEISLRASPHSAYAKFPHPASHYAVVGVAANLELQGGKIAQARIAVTGVGDRAYRATNVEKALVGVNPNDAGAVKAACVDAGSGTEPRSDVFASGKYRAAMAEVYAARAVAAAAKR
ncbi:MAG: xanthine dehydrogenase family protein subunit M [Candidatus Eremiobacteraeota bacterium]|nr:xanthine dehydrogenase family protein subunit M [Candidatus Eremiobacteraeota bacterium]